MADKRRFIERATDKYDSATERITDAKDKTKETIQDHPFMSVVIAAAVGAAVGVAASETIRMIRRRRR